MNIDKNLNMNQRYSIDGSDVAFFNAQIMDNGNYSTNFNIADRTVYKANRDQVLDKFKEFEDEVDRIAEKVKVEGGLCK